MTTEPRRRASPHCAAALAAACLCCFALGWAGEPEQAEAHVHQAWADARGSGKYSEVIATLEALAEQYAQQPDVAALAHLRIVDALEHKGDLDGAIAKAKWLASAFPKARAPQFFPFGNIPRTMADEWREWVDKRPICIRDFMWMKLAELYGTAKRRDEELAAYDHILATVPVDPLPDTKNIAIVDALRLHKDALAAKISLLRRMRRYDEAKEAERLQEKLYPAAEWLKLRIAANKARPLYSKESEELTRREREAEFKKLQELEEKARREREAEEKARQEREAEMRARDEERRQKYLKRKREREAREKAKKQADSDAAQPSDPTDKAKRRDVGAGSSRKNTDAGKRHDVFPHPTGDKKTGAPTTPAAIPIQSPGPTHKGDVRRAGPEATEGEQGAETVSEKPSLAGSPQDAEATTTPATSQGLPWRVVAMLVALVTLLSFSVVVLIRLRKRLGHS